MLNISYSSLTSSSIELFLKVIKKSGLYIVALVVMHFFYQYLLTKLLGNSKNLSIYLSTYNIFIYPALTIFILHFIHCSLENRNPLDIDLLFQDAKRCYGSIFIFYFTIYILHSFIGNTAGLLLFIIIYLKLPFIEASIFLNKSSLWESIKENNELTQNKMLRYMFMIVGLFLLSSILLNTTLNIQSSALKHNEFYAVIFNILRMLIIFLAKIYLAVLYYSLIKSKISTHKYST